MSDNPAEVLRSQGMEPVSAVLMGPLRPLSAAFAAGISASAVLSTKMMPIT